MTKLIFKISHDLDGKKYFFVPTEGYNQCPFCEAFGEIQASYYGHYIEGPGYIFFPENIREICCPHCLKPLFCLTDYAWWRNAAIFECEGFDIIAEDATYALDKISSEALEQ